MPFGGFRYCMCVSEPPPPVCARLFSLRFVAHALGWWGKMVMFRHWGVCWILSLAFEAMECSLQFIIPEFKECWWDSLLIDLLGASFLFSEMKVGSLST